MLSYISNDVLSTISTATCHSHCEKVFPDVQTQRPVFQFFFYCACFCEWVPLRLALSPLDPLFTYLCLIVLFSRLNNSKCLSLFSQERWSCALVIFVALCWTIQYLCISVILRSPELDRGLKEWPHQFWGKGRITCTKLLANLIECTQHTIGLLCSKGSLMASV